MVSLSVIILTYNEEQHIERCIDSILPITQNIIVVDSFSTDKTLEIAKSKGALIYQNPFVNQAIQFQWAMDNCPIETEWVMRLDADEYILPELAETIKKNLNNYLKDITGLYVKRRVYFMDKWIKHGGCYPIRLLRIWRNGKGEIEQRWMDEHIKLLEGKSIEIKGDIVDHNLHSLTTWTQKHNNYATREAVDLLNYMYNLFENKPLTIENIYNTVRADIKTRKNKENYYVRSPLFLRAFMYFIMRYIFKFGFLDGKAGLMWNFLQGFWYRFLVDAKIYQIKHLAKKKNKTVIEILKEDFNFKL